MQRLLKNQNNTNKDIKENKDEKTKEKRYLNKFDLDINEDLNTVGEKNNTHKNPSIDMIENNNIKAINECQNIQNPGD